MSDSYGTFDELNNLVSNGGEITLNKSYKYDSSFSYNTINILKPTKINGNGYSIDACNKIRIFTITSSVILNNITFINSVSDSNTGDLGGALLINANNSSIRNCMFINNSASLGGAIYFTGNNLSIHNTVFDHNDCNEGVVYIDGNYSNISDSKFINSNGRMLEAIYGSGNYFNIINSNFNNLSGGICWAGNYLNFNKCNFTNIKSTSRNSIWVAYRYIRYKYANITECVFINSTSKSNHGGALMSENDYSNISNCIFINASSSDKTGGAVELIGANSILTNSIFNTCYASSGGAIYSAGNNNTIKNCNITNCKVSSFAAGIYILGENNTVIDVNIFNSSGASYGGSIFWHGAYGQLNNTVIINSTASWYGGGIYWQSGGYNSSADNIIIKNSNALIGGGIYWNADNGTVRNSYFENASAYHSGGIYISGDNIQILNSNFTNNNALYGGGAIGNIGKNSRIINSRFEKNKANNYGGALSVTDTYVANSTFIENSAVFGGAIYTINSTIKKLTFNDNTASELGSKVFAINKATIIDCTVDGDDLYENLLTKTTTIPYITDYSKLTAEVDGKTYDIYTSEYNLLSWSSWDKAPDAIIDYSPKLLKNKLDSSDVSEYVKILLYYYSSNSRFKYSYEKYLPYSIWTFTDSNYMSSTYSLVQYAISLYNSGFRAPNVEIIDNKAYVYEYIGLITPAPFRNTFFMRTTELTVGLDVTKECLNKTAFVGDTIQFRINITNTGEFNLSNVFINEIFDNSQLEYIDNDLTNWTYNKSSNTFNYKNNLSANEKISLVLSFKALTNTTIINTVCAGFNNTVLDNDSASIRVYKPDITFTKVAIPRVVPLGNQVEFEIIVRNTGDIDLTGIQIVEDQYEGLTYAGYHNTTIWSYAFVNDKHVWSLKENLTVDAEHRLFVFFNASATGNFTNYAIVKSNELSDKKANATVSVLNHNFTVEKVALETVVKIGNQAVFEIVVHNTGETDLEGVFVIEDSYDGLIFDHVRQATRWTMSTTADGKLKWNFNEVLPSHEWVFLFMVFNTTELGNFTNTVIAGSDNTINKTANASVLVNETVYKPEGDVYELNISITTIHPLVIVGNQTMFEVIVHNVGNTILHNVTVAEHLFDGLIFDHFRDYTGFWNALPTSKLSDNGLLGAPVIRDLTWQMNNVLYVGEYTGFFIVFNTTKTGVFSNTVLGSSEETSEKAATDTVDVIKPEYDIEKTCLNEVTVYVDDEIHFQIIVKNTGRVDLTNLVVKELPEKGLTFINIIDEDEMWEADGLTFKLKENVSPNETVGFIAVFKASTAGTYNNTVQSSTDNLDDKLASDTVRVVPENPNYDVEIDTKVINTPVYVGNTSLVKIIVTNTGNDELSNVFVNMKFNKLLNYVSYTNGTHNWIKSGNTFNLVGVLKVGESATFYVLLNTTKTGNFSSLASVGFNNTVKDNSSFVIEAINKTSPNQQSNKTSNPSKNNTDVNSTKSSSNNNKFKTGDKATGNPVIVLLIVLLNLVILRRKN